ncbi:MAG: endo alpha-1,4 polygalactosaminidase [Lachnospiraceae bacterium]
MGEYEDWPGEYWVNVSEPEWKDHIIEEAGLLTEKGVDGFFLDNTDVYDQYHDTEIFQGLIAIVKGLEQY